MSPLANSYIKGEDLNQGERIYPLQAYVCHRCFLVQVPSIAKPEEIFSEYPYFSSYSDSWLEHARSYVEHVTARFGLNHRSHVVEIASNDGYLLQFFIARGISALGIEPAGNVAQAAIARGVPTLVRFFGEDTARELRAQDKQADLIVANNVLAHVPDLTGFMRGLTILLRTHGVVTFEFPHLMRLIQENQFDTIYHEHLSYFSLLTILKLFGRNGLKVFDVDELTTHGGSLRIFAAHQNDDSKAVTERVREVLSKEEAAGVSNIEQYRAFGKRVQKTKEKLLDFLRAARERGKAVVGYGAPAKGNTLLNYCGVGRDLIQYTVDRNPQKQGYFLPGTHIPIYSPDRIEETKPDYVLILPWNIQEEIMSQMQRIREWNGRFVIPIPELKIL